MKWAKLSVIVFLLTKNGLAIFIPPGMDTILLTASGSDTVVRGNGNQVYLTAKFPNSTWRSGSIIIGIVSSTYIEYTEEFFCGAPIGDTLPIRWQLSCYPGEPAAYQTPLGNDTIVIQYDFLSGGTVYQGRGIWACVVVAPPVSVIASVVHKQVQRVVGNKVYNLQGRQVSDTRIRQGLYVSGEKLLLVR